MAVRIKKDQLTPAKDKEEATRLQERANQIIGDLDPPWRSLPGGR